MISVQDIRKSYGSLQALDRVSFEVPAGQILGFLGPNGAGKTTMMKILTTFISPTAGTAKVAGYDVLDDSLEVRRRLGYLPEQCPIYDDVTVYEYLEYVAEARDLPADRLQQRLYRTLELCGLTGRVDQIIGTLSKGYRQRVGLAQAMIHEPDVLILDEPTSGLDPNQIVEIREVIKRIGREKTVILSTHILSEVQATCDRVVIINQGRLIADGTPDDLVRQMGSNDLVVGLKRSGCKLEEARELLGKLPGVVSVGEQRGEEEGTLLLRLGVGGKQDVRPELFRAVVERGWVLLELRRAEHNLEDVFRQLTTGK
ncbi:MAG: ATP-binding cassette domain-containing protein [Myxococcota bacterium]|jgi:ABC-2 type transport system ATP-binding protein|nr:ATP-binding cassette domain-containing protein [Myxococcota bacterium]